MAALAAYLHTEPGREHQAEAMLAFSMGWHIHGHRVTGDPLECDLAVSWGTRGNIPPGTPRLLLEAGYINGRSGHYVADRLRFVSASWNELHGCASPGGPVRPPNRWERLGIELAPWRKRRSRAIVLLQHPGDRMSPPKTRMDAAAARLGYLYDRVDEREHPLCADVPPLSSVLANYDVALTWSSTAAVETVVAGLPTIALGEACVARPVCSHAINAPLFLGDREQWAYDLAYRQFTLDEYRDGTAWEHLRYGIDASH